MKKLKYVKLFENFDEMVEMINEDNLEIKKIAKDLYLWLKKNGVKATLFASFPGQEFAKKIGDKEFYCFVDIIRLFYLKYSSVTTYFESLFSVFSANLF